MKTVKVLEPIHTVSPVTGKPRQRRIVILQRDDGHFSFVEEYSYRLECDGKVIAEGWARLPTGSPIFANAESAEAEAQRLFHLRYGL